MMKAIRWYMGEYGWTGLITDRFSPINGWLADKLRALADRLGPQQDPAPFIREYRGNTLQSEALLPGVQEHRHAEERAEMERMRRNVAEDDPMALAT